MKIHETSMIQTERHSFWDKAGFKDEVKKRILEEIKAANLPVTATIETIKAGTFRKGREYLIVKGEMKDVAIIISSESYGNFLHVNVNLINLVTMKKGLIGSFKGAFGAVFENHNLMQAGKQSMISLSTNPFDQDDYSRYWTSVSEVVKFALDNLNLKKGFAGLSE